MSPEQIGCFPNATRELFSSMLSADVTLGTFLVDTRADTQHDIPGVIGISGNIVGAVVLSLPMQAALACDGLDAKSKVSSFQHDLILLDWNMPSMSGVEFLKQYRQEGSTAPVIKITTEAEKARVPEAIKPGANNCVVKPYTPDALAERVNTTLAKARAA